MNAWARRRWLRLALAAICLGMLGVIGAELTAIASGDDPAVAVERSPRADTPAPLSFAMPPRDAFSEVTQRPLFSPTRRPGTTANGLAASSSFTLVAIVISARDRRALLGSGQPSKIVRVHEGQDIAGWTVEAILPDKVIVRHADVREEVKAKDGMRSADVALTAPASVGASVTPGGAPQQKWQHRAHDE
jgi:hypothetical protein